MAKLLGAGDYRYEAVDLWPKTEIDGVISDVAADSRDRVYIAVRTAQDFDHNRGAVVVFGRGGEYLDSSGEDKLRTPHGIWINPDDEVAGFMVIDELTGHSRRR